MDMLYYACEEFKEGNIKRGIEILVDDYNLHYERLEEEIKQFKNSCIESKKISEEIFVEPYCINPTDPGYKHHTTILKDLDITTIGRADDYHYCDKLISLGLVRIPKLNDELRRINKILELYGVDRSADNAKIDNINETINK